MSRIDFRVDNRQIHRYFTTLSDCLTQAAVTSTSGKRLEMAEAANQCMINARRTHAAGDKLIFVGNGGSAAIASHRVTDYSKNGGVRSLALNDGSMLTCLGHDQVFSDQLELHARSGDLVIAISSSGRSANILNAVKVARAADCSIITLSGFDDDNPLRRLGDVNFYLASDRYGVAEVGHPTICHAILDFICGLRVPDGKAPTQAHQS